MTISKKNKFHKKFLLQYDKKKQPDWWLGNHGKDHNESNLVGTMEYGSIKPLGAIEHLENFWKINMYESILYSKAKLNILQKYKSTSYTSGDILDKIPG